MQIDELLKLMVDKGASDLHLKVPSPPVLRIDGVLVPQEDLPPVIPKDIEMVFEHITTQRQKETFSLETISTAIRAAKPRAARAGGACIVRQRHWFLAANRE